MIEQPIHGPSSWLEHQRLRPHGHIEVSPALESDRVEVFEKIFEDHLSLCVWNRGRDAALESFFRERQGQEDSFTVRHRLGERIEDSLPAGLRESGHFDDFAAELRGLVDLYSTLADAEAVGLRFLSTASQPCPRFHSDRVQLRLICTWTGPGTEWIRLGDLKSVCLRMPQIWKRDQTLIEGAVIKRLNPFAIGLFKGEQWPGGTSILHRSPPLGEGEMRAMVSIDTL